ncbi:glycosyl transferase group 1 (plasmid) [Herpetosiphon aurantiacus DSM 785]|uniref:Glycosyl transferase group 1 n=1 Tax=Herpetosiphon aurantiacus (strain ATCC 23779 / DSM 785 / 114-95) TaxID=316274 RepID=A9B8Q8_HERA2|nr:glycosyl transferase group 1 [Herpetosiphon aurantiacus DSM 785]
MRIALVLSTPLPACEGIGFYVWNLGRFLTHHGHEVHIITRGEPTKPAYEQVQAIHIWRPAFWRIYPFHVDMHGYFVTQTLETIANTYGLDLIHVHTPLVKIPKSAYPVVVTVHTPMKTDTAAIPLRSVFDMLIKLQTPFSIRLEKRLFRQATTITTVATSVASELGAYGLQPHQVAVVGNGVDTATFYPPVDLQARFHQRYFLTVGRLAPRKGLEDLIASAAEVVKRYPTYRFFIVGQGPLAAVLQKQITQLHLDQHVQLLGHMADREQLADLYRGAWAYIHPAHYEGLPTALLEAMACGCPVVATAVSGALDVITPHNGVLVNPHAPVQLTQAVCRFIEQPQVARDLGQQAALTIQQQYGWTAIGQRYLATYHHAIQGATA